MVKMRKQNVILIVVILLTIITIASIGTYAYWSGDSDADIAGTRRPIVSYEDNTYKYLVFEAKTVVDSKTYTTYLSWDLANDRFKIDTSYCTTYDDEIIASNLITTITNLSVMGYKGNLGEYESVNIPSEIGWWCESNSTVVVTSVTEINMQTSEEFPSLDNIVSVVIPSSVTSINGVSFSALGNLDKVYFNSKTYTASISTNAFLSSKSIVFYKLQSDGVTYDSGVGVLPR